MIAICEFAQIGDQRNHYLQM